MNRGVSSLRSRRRASEWPVRLVRTAAVLVLLVGAGAVARAAATPRPGATPGPARAGAAKLPTLSTKDSPIEVRGKILRSTRGHPGPVRLRVEKSDGGQIDVLVAADELCQRLGLALRVGDEVQIRGALFAGRKPILVASVVVVDGKEIAVRNRGLVGSGVSAPAERGEP
jgi:hypothetical protein